MKAWDCFLSFLFTGERRVVRGACEESLKKWKRADHPSLLSQAVISGVEGELDNVCMHACVYACVCVCVCVCVQGWPKGSFWFFHNILQKNMNKLFGQVHTHACTHMHTHTRAHAHTHTHTQSTSSTYKQVPF